MGDTWVSRMPQSARPPSRESGHWPEIGQRVNSCRDSGTAVVGAKPAVTERALHRCLVFPSRRAT